MDVCKYYIMKRMVVIDELFIGVYLGVFIYLFDGEIYGILCSFKYEGDVLLVE